MTIKDKTGTNITLYQGRTGKIYIPIGDRCITLAKEDAEMFSLYDIEDFNQELFLQAYRNGGTMKRGPKPKFKDPFRMSFKIERSWTLLIAQVTKNRSEYINTAIREKMERDGLLESPHDNT